MDNKKTKVILSPECSDRIKKIKKMIYETSVTIKFNQAELLACLDHQWNLGIKALEEMNVDEEKVKEFIKAENKQRKISERIQQLNWSKRQNEISLEANESLALDNFLSSL